VAEAADRSICRRDGKLLFRKASAKAGLHMTHM
jgi:hypothetical protein